MFKVSDLLKATKGKAAAHNEAMVESISIDSRKILPGQAFLAIKGDNFDGHDFVDEVINKGVKVIIVHKNIKIKNKGVCCIKVKDTVKALGDIARDHRIKFNIPVIAVTGSNGKTTTKEMIASILQASGKVLKNPGTKNNHIGLPQAILELDSTHDFAVFELGTNHFGEIDYLAKICKPDVSVITNVAASHLEHFRDLKGVLAEKYALIDSMNKNGLAILNSDDELLSKKLKSKAEFKRKFGFGIKNEAEFRASGIKTKGLLTEFAVNKKYKFALNTPGQYNIYNALSAIACGRIFGLEYGEIAKRLSEFSFPKGRLNLLEIDRIRFIDDTYNSNPYSFLRALEVLDSFDADGRKICVMGDMMELGSGKHLFHKQALTAALEICNVLITVGGLTEAAAGALKDAGVDTGKIFTCSTSQEAKEILFGSVSPKENDIVLVKGSRMMRMEEVFKV